MTFHQRLRSVQRKSNSLLCIGLDTDVTRDPSFLRRKKDPVVEFNRRIIDATHDMACSYKLNLAFYEGLGERGWHALHKTLAHIPPGKITIGDAKRGDIGNTAELYARSLFDDFGFDACTVSPYMGKDSVEPFLGNAARGVFVLAVTSNPGSMDFQHLKVKGKALYEHVIGRVVQWNTKNNCGLVVGATHPEHLKRARTMAPGLPFLIPGIGTQGGDLKACIKYGCDTQGGMVIINASRSIIYASSGRDFALEAQAAALKLKDDINRYREQFF